MLGSVLFETSGSTSFLQLNISFPVATECSTVSIPHNCFTLSTGSRPAPAQEITPTNLRLQRPANAASLHTTQQARRLHSPSPAILNFTLQNLGLISCSSPGNTFASPQTPERANALSSPLLSPLTLQQRNMLFIKPLSPVPVQHTVSPYPVAVISLQQVKMNSTGSGFMCSINFH